MHSTAGRPTAKHIHRTSPLVIGPTRAPAGAPLTRASRRPTQDSLSPATRSVDPVRRQKSLTSRSATLLVRCSGEQQAHTRQPVGRQVREREIGKRKPSARAGICGVSSELKFRAGFSVGFRGPSVHSTAHSIRPIAV